MAGIVAVEDRNIGRGINDDVSHATSPPTRLAQCTWSEAFASALPPVLNEPAHAAYGVVDLGTSGMAQAGKVVWSRAGKASTRH